MEFLRLWFRKVDPFAIYHAERQLAELGISVPRERLEQHYLMTGRLDGLVERLRRSPEADSANMDAQAFADDLIRADVADADNPRFVAPFKTGLVFSLHALLLAGFAIGLKLLIAGIPANPMVPLVIAGIAAGILLVSFAYAYLGAWLGRTRAESWLCIALLAALIPVIYWLTRGAGR